MSATSKARLTVDFVEPARIEHKAERVEHRHSNEIERQLVAKHRVGLHALDRSHSAAEHGLGRRVRIDRGECVAEHRHRDSKQQRVGQETIDNHKDGPKVRVEVMCRLEASRVETKVDLQEPPAYLRYGLVSLSEGAESVHEAEEAEHADAHEDWG